MYCVCIQVQTNQLLLTKGAGTTKCEWTSEKFEYDLILCNIKELSFVFRCDEDTVVQKSYLPELHTKVFMDDTGLSVKIRSGGRVKGVEETRLVVWQ